MSNITITDIDVGSVLSGEGQFRDATVTFGGADTLVSGTIMGQQTTSAASYTGVIVGTGVKTIALTALAGQSMKVGNYVLTVGNVTAGVGPGTLVDPDGVSASVTLAVSGAHDVPSLGVTFAITAGGTELDDNDTVTFTVAAGSKWVPFAPTEVNGAQNPSAVLTYDLTATGSGDLAARLCIGGVVKKERLIIDEDGDGDNVTEAILLALRSNSGLIDVATEQLGAYDNS